MAVLLAVVGFSIQLLKIRTVSLKQNPQLLEISDSQAKSRNHPSFVNKFLQPPFTSTSKKYPTRVKIKHNNQESWVVIDQIRTIDKIRIVQKFGLLTEKEIQECKRVLKEIFVD